MGREDLLLRVQRRARLHGPNETLRAVCAVAEALAAALPPAVFTVIAGRLPATVRDRVAPAVRIVPNCRAFLGIVEGRLLVDGPDAAFLARTVLEQLNATHHGVTPSTVAHLVAPDLRPLLCAGQNVSAGLPRRALRSTIRLRRRAAARRSVPATRTTITAAP